MLNIVDEGHVTINTPQIINAYGEYDLIIFNFPNASSVEMTGGSVHIDGNQVNTSAPGGVWPDQNAVLKKDSEKIIWNFPQADTIHIYAHGVVGSVVAPVAVVSTNGGSINGMLVADSFIQKNGHELHAFSMNPATLSFKNIDEQSEPNEPNEPSEPNKPNEPNEPHLSEENDEPDLSAKPNEPSEPGLFTKPNETVIKEPLVSEIGINLVRFNNQEVLFAQIPQTGAETNLLFSCSLILLSFSALFFVMKKRDEN